MDQNQSNNQSNADDDLQRAIDNITNTTNVDPVFSDPVAAPSTIPEGDTGQLAEPVGPFPEEPKDPAPSTEPASDSNPVIAPAPAPEIPSIPEPSNTPEIPSIPEPSNTPDMPPVTAETSSPSTTISDTSTPSLNPASIATPDISTPSISNFNNDTNSNPDVNASANQSNNLNVHQIKEAALRDLVPLLSRLNIDPEQKFGLYRNIFEELKDYSVLSSAYTAAKDIPGDTERAEALLYLIDSIDKM